MRSVHKYLTGKAQAVWPDAIVTEEASSAFRLERRGQEMIALGPSFGVARRTLYQMLKQATAFNHRELLRKYMQHVMSCEGTDFIEFSNMHSDVQFTPAEWAELEKISKEALGVVGRGGSNGR